SSEESSSPLRPPPLSLLNSPNSFGFLDFSPSAQPSRVRNFPHVDILIKNTGCLRNSPIIAKSLQLTTTPMMKETDTPVTIINYKISKRQS
ncbi:unnamed protein product, partial [Prunus brigantina]